MLLIDMQKTCNKYIKNYDKHKEQSYPKYSDVNNLYAQAMLQDLPVDDTKWVENTSQFT